MTGRVLVRFLKASKDTDDSENFMIYRNKLQIIRYVSNHYGSWVGDNYK